MGKLSVAWVGVEHWAIGRLPTFCGCKIWEIGPLWITWTPARGCDSSEESEV